MKLDKYLKTSLARQYGVLTFTIIFVFSLLVAALMIYENSILDNFDKESRKLEVKETIVSDLDYSFNLAISEMRAYFAYKGEQTYYNKVQEQRDIVDEKISELENVADTEEDVLFIQQTKDFYDYYFEDVIPRPKSLYDNNQPEEVYQPKWFRYDSNLSK